MSTHMWDFPLQHLQIDPKVKNTHGLRWGESSYLQCTTMGPGMAAACRVSSTLDTKCSRGLADSGVCWSGQEGKRMCLTRRHSPSNFSSTEEREIRMWERRLTGLGQMKAWSPVQAKAGQPVPISSALLPNPSLSLCQLPRRDPWARGTGRCPIQEDGNRCRVSQYGPHSPGKASKVFWPVSAQGDYGEPVEESPIAQCKQQQASREGLPS